MKLITPQTISLVSSTIAASSVSEWAVGTTYGDGDIVLDSRTQPYTTYTSQQAANTGNDPATDDGTWWVSNGATERWKMFDDYVSTQSSSAEFITVVLNITNIDTLALFNLQASSIDVSLYDNATSSIVFTTSVDLTANNVPDWYEYFFSTVKFRTDVKIDIPQYNSAILTVTINKTDGIAKCGHLVVGKAVTLGVTKYNPSIGILDYSKKTTDPDFGFTYLVQGVWAKKIEIDVQILNDTIDFVYSALADIRGIPVVFECNNITTDHGTFLVYGFFREFLINVPTPTISYCTINIEGLV